MSIKVAEDLGTAWYDSSSGNCYHRIGTIAGPPDTTIEDGDDIQIEQIDFGTQNSDPYKSVWTPCQVCVALHISGLRPYHKVTSSEVGTYVEFYTAPTDGELRFGSTSGTPGHGLYASKDKDYMIRDSGGRGLNLDSDKRAIRMASGDTVYLGAPNNSGSLNTEGRETQAWFLPDSYNGKQSF